MNEKRSHSKLQLQEAFEGVYEAFDQTELPEAILRALQKESEAAQELLQIDSASMRKYFEIEEDVVAETMTASILREIRTESFQESENQFLLFWRVGVCVTPLTAMLICFFLYSVSVLDIFTLGFTGLL